MINYEKAGCKILTKVLNKTWGYILFSVAKLLDIILGSIAKGISFIVGKMKKIKDYIFSSILSRIGFFIFLPLLIRLITFSLRFVLLMPWLFVPILVLILLPLLGTFFRYWHYVLCEYLYDKSSDFINGTSKGQLFENYGKEFYRKQAAEEEAERKRKFAEEEAAREARRKQQEAQWSRVFEEFFRNFAGGTYTNYGGPGSRGQAGGTYNPTFDFRRKYHESCDALGLPYDADEEQVKLSYRKLAKQYHPDLNKSPDATTKFQEISNAYEFLSKENMDRYQRLSRM